MTEQNPQTAPFLMLSANDWHIYNAKLDRLESSTQKVFALANSNEIFTPNEVCKLLKISLKTLSNWRDSRKIEFVQVGLNVRFTKQQIEDFITRNSLKIKELK
jgi:excisionase family DNA binding protein